MKLALFGATGRVGRSVARRAHEDGYTVRALVRDRERAEALLPFAELVEGDVTCLGDVQRTMQGCDRVFSALNTGQTTTLSDSIPLIISAMHGAALTRIVLIGTAGILNSRYEAGKYRFQTAESRRTKTFAAEEHAKVFEALQQTSLDWTMVCPTYLPDGEAVGHVRYEENVLPLNGRFISVADAAHFAYKTWLDDTFLQTRVGICY